MAKYYYKCVHQVDLAYKAPYGRGGAGQAALDEDGNTPNLVTHWIRIMPSPGRDARGRMRPPMYICTDRPLAKHLTEQIVKKVSRPNFDPQTGRKLPSRAYRKKVTKVKFVQIPNSEMRFEIEDRAIKKAWVEEMFRDGPTTVELPIDPELEKQMAILGPDDEPADVEERPPDRTLVKGRK